ncbi:MAG TPA: cyclic nucleotide-binding domain-containing protein [Candidatus Limnocylindrales bacterium]|nr:cyclic nucleotide-binding domain-containing protein [Candidatus Limnocylindrales bacterium]
MDRKLELLKTVPLFADLDERSLDAVGVLAREIEVPEGHVLMLEGEPGDAFYVIVEGTIRVERASGVAKSMTAGGFLGEIALLEGGLRTATATAESDCRLLVIHRHEFDRLMSALPHIERRIRTASARRPHAHGGDTV